MEKVYSDGFILDCANPHKVFKYETLQIIKNLIQKRQLQISIFESNKWIEKIQPLRNGNEIERFTYNQIMDWFSGSRLANMVINSSQLSSTVLPKGVSSIWLENVDQEEEILDFLNKNALLSLIKEDIIQNKFSWLFKVSELPTIGYDSHFNWSDYLSPYAHYTDKVFIWDRYFLYNWSRSLSDLIGPFLDINPDLEVEIVSEMDQNNDSYEYGLKNINSLKEEFGDRIHFYKPNPDVGKRHHDRYLMTSYCLLKSEPGFNIFKHQKKSFRETTPTLVGRYAEGNHKWNTEMGQWERRKIKDCEPISV